LYIKAVMSFGLLVNVFHVLFAVKISWPALASKCSERTSVRRNRSLDELLLPGSKNVFFKT